MSKRMWSPARSSLIDHSWCYGLILFCALTSGCALRNGQSAQMNQPAMDQAAAQSSQGQGAASSMVQTASYQEEVEGTPVEMPAPVDSFSGRPLPEGSTEPHFRSLQNEGVQHAFPNQDSVNGAPNIGAPEGSYRFSDPAGSRFAQPPPALPLSQYGGETWQGGIPQQGGRARSTYNNGVNVVGSEFRIPNRTATELMIDYKDENHFLKERIIELNTDIGNLKQDLARETTAHETTAARLEHMVRQERQLREMIASLQVKVEDLEAAKVEAKKQFDSALQQIETNLDAALLNSMSRPSGTSSLSDQTP